MCDSIANGPPPLSSGATTIINNIFLGAQAGNTISNLNASNLAFGIVDSKLVYGNTLSNINYSNVTGRPWIYSGTQNIFTLNNVGIWTSTPGSNLEVQGNVYVSNSVSTTNVYASFASISNIYTTNIVGFVGSQWTGPTGSTIYYVPNVGIGTSIVGAKLQVQGNIYASNALTTTNVFAYDATVSNTIFTGNLYASGTTTVSYDGAFSSALSPDGSTLVLGTIGTSPTINIYSTNSTTCLQSISNVDASSRFGWAVSTNYDASTILASDPGQSTIHVFTKSGSTWNESAVITPPFDVYGYSVSMDYFGTYFVAGTHNGASDAPTNVAELWTNSGGTWSNTTYFTSVFGIGSCSISGDASTVAFGVPNYSTDTLYIGTVYTGARTDSSLTQIYTGTLHSYTGYHVSLSRDGKTLVVNDSPSPGTPCHVYVFKNV